ncbi:MAG: Ig-like domain-containing protein [Bacteroidetes bacterium]|nr:Ig-like domain-containing protein [Bacteroidota bacterium]
MKPIFLKFAAFLLILTGILVSCSKTKVTDVLLNKTELTLSVGETETLVVTVFPEDADNKAVSWASNNPAIATVTNGKITAKAVGTAMIIVTTADGNKTANCTVIVIEEKPQPIELELGLYTEVSPCNGCGNWDFIDRENLTTHPMLGLPAHFKYEIVEDSIKLTDSYGRTTNHHFYVINSTKFEIDLSEHSSPRPFIFIFEKDINSY